ncbi:MAG: divalent metal cation transporter [Candidatus Roizmanbacteria bacterium]
MRNFLNRFKKQLIIFLAVVGPGLITAIADNDAGGVATYTVAAATYGMASKFMFIPETLLLALTQEIGARIAIVTRKGLGDLIRERYGIKLSLFIFILYFITNQGVVLQNVSGLKSSLQLFNLPWQFFLIIFCALLIFIVIKFNYRKLQNIFLFMILFYLAYIISAWLAHPNWKEAIQESIIWPKKVDIRNAGFWFSRIAVLGTTITAWGQFFVHSYILDKKLTIDHLKAEKVEVYLGAIVTSIFSWMMAVAVTYTIFANKVHVVDGYSAALAMKPLAGQLSTILFSVGLFGASILGLTIVPLATAYVFSELFGYEGSLDANFKKGRLFYGFFILQITLGLIITLFPQTSLFKLTLYADYLNGVMLPIIFFFLIKFSEDEEIMGKYTSRGFTSFFVRLSGIVITIAVILTFVGKVFKF